MDEASERTYPPITVDHAAKPPSRGFSCSMVKGRPRKGVACLIGKY